MILHLLEDDKNIVKRTIDMYEKLIPGNNEYWVEDCGEHAISFTEEQGCIKRLKFDYLIDKVDPSKYSAIIFHALSPSKISFLSQLPRSANLKLIWILWGADMYTHIRLKGYKLLNYEPSIFNLKERILFYDGLRGVVPTYIKKLIKRINSVLTNFEKATSKLDFICANEEDFSLLKKYFPRVSAKCLFYNYFPIEISLGDKLIDQQISGNNILIGNSSTWENNHYSAFQIIKKSNISSKVIVPLSYGNLSYRKFVIEKGNKLLGNKFVPLLDFLPIDEYYEILLSCGIAMMPYLRQQAVGNIVIALYLGAKVFLYEENPLYAFFIKIGVTIFSLDKLAIGNETLEMLDIQTVKQNKYVINKYFSTAATEKYIEELIEKIGIVG